MADITSATKSMSEVLSPNASAYYIDYYQRAYTWSEVQVNDLLTDLLTKFEASYDENDKADSVSSYTQYFLGTYVVCSDEETNQESLIDGQQRLTTMMLLFLAIYHVTENIDTWENSQMRSILRRAQSYVVKDSIGDLEFAIDVPDRQTTMVSIFNQNSDYFNDENNTNLVSRNYLMIYDRLLDYAVEDQKKFFSFYGWVTKRVMMLKIMTNNSNDAYEVFESMNDRGKPLTKLEMLKGYLLSKVDQNDRTEAIRYWDNALKNFTNEKEFDKFIVDLFRAKYAKNTAQTEASRKLKNSYITNDWNDIKSHYHRFIKDKHSLGEINLSDSKSALTLFRDINYYAKYCNELTGYKNNLTQGFEEIYYIDKLASSSINHLFYALIIPFDKHKDEKTKLISKFLHFRNGLLAWNLRDVSNEGVNSTYFVRLVSRVKKFEYTDINCLVWFFHKEAEDIYVKSNGFHSFNVPSYSNNTASKKNVKYILASLTSFIELKDKNPNNFNAFYDGKGYDVEHVLASKHEVNPTFFADQEMLDSTRNKIGALGLLSKSHNSSFQDKSYDKKVTQYPSHNILLGSLHEGFYNEKGNFENRSQLNKFVYDHPELKGKFKPYKKMDKIAIQERNELFCALSKIMWNSYDLLDFRQKDIFDTVTELFEYYNAEFVNDKNEYFQEDVNHDFNMLDELVYAEGERKIEATYTGRNRVAITKISNGKYETEFTDSLLKEKTIMKLYKQIVRTAVNEEASYDWLGKIEGVPLNAMIKLVRGTSSSLRSNEINVVNTQQN